jgi:hypothetical protein
MPDITYPKLMNLWNGMNQLEERNSALTLTARYAHGESVVPGVGIIVEVQRITATSTYYIFIDLQVSHPENYFPQQIDSSDYGPLENG